MLKNSLKFVIYAILIFTSTLGIAQVDSSSVTKQVKKGFSFGGIPVLGYNTDKGFSYGAAFNLFNFGDGSSYPNYKYSLFCEISRTTKKNGINQIFFDSRELLPNNIRLIADFSLNTDKLLPFYGFNGYNASYNANFEQTNNPLYKSRAYYRMDRRELRAIADVQGDLILKNFRWVLGLGYQHFKMRSVDIENINSSLDDDEKLPQVPSLYDEYVNAGIIGQNEKNGGDLRYFKAGAIYDSRDNEPNPSKGIWAECVIMGAPAFAGNTFSFNQFGAIVRHYFTIVNPRLTMANRIGWQSLLSGRKPYYLQPFLYSTFKLVEAFGGSKTIRGIMANRLIGNAVAFGNFELRYKFFISTFLKQDFYIAASSFLDWGIVTSPHPVDNSIVLPQILIKNTDRPHYAAGGGIRFAINQNFIVAIDYGKALNANDGNNALYIGLDFLY